MNNQDNQTDDFSFPHGFPPKFSCCQVAIILSGPCENKNKKRLETIESLL
jgi:hypothetical protein